MRPPPGVHHAGRRVWPHPRRPALVRGRAAVEGARQDQRIARPPQVAFQPRDQRQMCLPVGPAPIQPDAAVFHRHPAVGRGQVLGHGVKVQRVIGDPVRGAPGQARGRGEDRPRHPAQHLDVAQRFPLRAAGQVVVVDHQRLLVDRAVPAPGMHRQHGRGIVVHEVPPDLVRAIGKPPRVRLGARGQQQRRRVHRARRQHHRRGRQPPPVCQPQGGDAVAVGFQRSDSRAGQQRDIRMPQRLRDAHGFRVHLGAGRVRKGVPWRLGTFQPTVEIHPQRQVRGVQPDPAQAGAQVRDLGLVGHRRVREGG